MKASEGGVLQPHVTAGGTVTVCCIMKSFYCEGRVWGTFTVIFLCIYISYYFYVPGSSGLAGATRLRSEVLICKWYCSENECRPLPVFVVESAEVLELGDFFEVLSQFVQFPVPLPVEVGLHEGSDLTQIHNRTKEIKFQQNLHIIVPKEDFKRSR